MPLSKDKLLKNRYTREQVEELVRETINRTYMSDYYSEAKIQECINSWGKMYGFKGEEEETENEFGEVSP